MKVVIMVDKSAGNDSVGNMWTETLIFPDSATLKEVLGKIDKYRASNGTSIPNTITMQIPIEINE